MSVINPNVDEETWNVEQTEEPEEHEQDVITYQINYYPVDFTLKGYLDKWQSKQLYVPSFQRNYVWDQVQASKLIESFLLGLPVPGVFLYKERMSNRMQIIDGQQRILSAIRFFKNEFEDKAFRLKGVQPKWEGKRYEDLEEAERFQLDDAVLRATVVQQIDPNDDASIYHIFERLNTGGMKLTPMEIRKCVYLSDFYHLLEELNALPEWREIIGQAKIDKRLRDVEFILRILALAENVHEYEKPMKKFLNSYMSIKRKLSPEKLSEIRETFTEVCHYVLAHLGPKSFHLRGRLNYAVMDSTMGIAFLAVQRNISDFKKRYDALVEDKEYYETVTLNTSDEKFVKRRFELAEQYLVNNRL